MTAKTAREIIPTVPRAARSHGRSVDFLSFPRACLARARNPEFRRRT